MKNTHVNTCNMARVTEKVENLEMSTVGSWNMSRKLKIMENEKHPLDDWENNEITEKCEK